MKTLKAVLKQYPEYKGIIKYTYENLVTEDYNRMPDIIQHGINGGYGGFTWYTDTTAMANKYQKEILKLIEDYAEQFGEDELKFCLSFNAYKDLDSQDKKDLYRYLGGVKVKNNDTITDTMCKFAGKEVCRWFCEDDE